jgi:hypothetical protein
MMEQPDGTCQVVTITLEDANAAADALADWINGCPCDDPAVVRALLNRLAGASYAHHVEQPAHSGRT